MKNEETEYLCPSISASWTVMGFVFLCLGVIHLVGLYPDKMIRWVWFASFITALVSIFGTHCAWFIRLNKYKITDCRDAKYLSPSITFSWILFGIGTLYSVLLMLTSDWEDRDTQFLSLFSYTAVLTILYVIHTARIVSSKSNNKSKSSSDTEKKNYLFELMMWSIVIIWAGSFISFFIFVIKPLFFIMPSKVFWGLIGLFSWFCSFIAVGEAITIETEEKTVKHERMDNRLRRGTHRDKHMKLLDYDHDAYLENYRKHYRKDHRK